MMQIPLPFSVRQRAGAPRPVRVGARVHLVRFVRVRQARRYVLRIRADGTLRVSVPPFGSLGEATSFVRSQRAWIERHHAEALRVAAAQPLPQETTALKKRARRELPARLLELAAQHDLTVSRVSVRAQRTLWGSCSRRHGSISLNWRLVRMPEAIRDYILLHELAHLRHANHSRRFWALVESLCPAYREAERWLKRHAADV